MTGARAINLLKEAIRLHECGAVCTFNNAGRVDDWLTCAKDAVNDYETAAALVAMRELLEKTGDPHYAKISGEWFSRDGKRV